MKLTRKLNIFALTLLREPESINKSRADRADSQISERTLTMEKYHVPGGHGKHTKPKTELYP